VKEFLRKEIQKMNTKNAQKIVAVLTAISLAFLQAVPAGVAANAPVDQIDGRSVPVPVQSVTDVPSQPAPAQAVPSGSAVKTTSALSEAASTTSTKTSSVAAAPTVPVNIAVNVGVNQAGVVTSVQVGEYGSFLTKSTINRLFDANQDGVVTQKEFDSKKQAINWSNYSVAPPKIILSNGATATDATNFQKYMDEAKRYMAQLDFAFTPPQAIYLGDGASGSYSDGTNWHLALDRTALKEVAVSKVTQGCLLKAFPNLGYTAMEAFSRYFLFNIMGFPTSRMGAAYTYNSSFESLTGDNIYSAYQQYNARLITKAQLDTIIRNTGNNNFALTQMMLEIKDGIGISTCNDLVLRALKSLGSNPQGAAIHNAFIAASTGKSYSKIVAAALTRHKI
jgi:hypothetical protein